MKIVIDVNQQRLQLLNKQENTLFWATISTAKNGVGELFGSEKTPLGRHIVRAKIGANCPLNTVFVGRRPTKKIYTQALATQFSQRDWILTRILWLSGCEVGVNRLGKVDTMRRYIYIHGAPDSHKMGRPSSHGCIKMRNQDIITLFNRVSVGIHVEITYKYD